MWDLGGGEGKMELDKRQKGTARCRFNEPTIEQPKGLRGVSRKGSRKLHLDRGPIVVHYPA